jgi:predicted nucleotidyltransferase
VGLIRQLSEVATDEPPWPLLLEVTRATPPGSWVLMGGMMVHLHALRARVAPSRPTTDVDVLLDLAAIASSVSAVASPLLGIGFEPVEPGEHFHRFTRGDDVVDIMVANSAGRARWAQRPILRTAGANYALADPDIYVVDAAGEQIEIRVPNIAASLVLKGAAYRDDQRDRNRHLEDLTVLLACDDRTDLRERYGQIPKSQKANLRPAVERLSEPGHPAWLILDPYDKALAEQSFSALISAL